MQSPRLGISGRGFFLIIIRLLPVMPLSETQRQEIETVLKQERDRALRALNRSVDERSDEADRDSDGDLSSIPFHAADRGTDTMQEELDASNSTRVSRELTEIDDALDRLYREPDRFGVSEKTGKPIPFERLKLIPWARD